MTTHLTTAQERADVIRRLKAFRGPYIGDGVNTGIHRDELLKLLEADATTTSAAGEVTEAMVDAYINEPTTSDFRQGIRNGLRAALAARPVAQADAGAVDVRTAFHCYLQARGIPSDLFQRGGEGRYEIATVEHDWEVWQAASAIAASAQATQADSRKLFDEFLNAAERDGVTHLKYPAAQATQAVEPVAWMDAEGRILSAEQMRNAREYQGAPGKKIAEAYSMPLVPASAAVQEAEPASPTRVSGLISSQNVAGGRVVLEFDGRDAAQAFMREFATTGPLAASPASASTASRTEDDDDYEYIPNIAKSPLPKGWNKAPAPIPAPEGLSPLQEPKYTVNGSAIVNRASGEAIPADEPVFIFRARDVHAREALEAYACVLKPGEHRDAVTQRVADFCAFGNANPSRMKEPDTDATRQTAGKPEGGEAKGIDRG